MVPNTQTRPTPGRFVYQLFEHRLTSLCVVLVATALLCLVHFLPHGRAFGWIRLSTVFFHVANGVALLVALGIAGVIAPIRRHQVDNGLRQAHVRWICFAVISGVFWSTLGYLNHSLRYDL